MHPCTYLSSWCAHDVLQPFEFIVGEPVGAVAGKRISEGANGLFSGQGGPEPPIVLSTAVVGMKDGGKVRAGQSWPWLA
jgi:hypothetical protein